MNVAILGGGPAGLMAAEVLASAAVRVTVYDRMPSVGRKFLLAGRGGLNLTHSEPLEKFQSRYGEAETDLHHSLKALSSDMLRAWCEALGQETFIGSSGRVFPKAFKASPLLRAWLQRLNGLGVQFALRHRWTGWTADGVLSFDTPQGERSMVPDAVVIALGGASWPKLGSDGGWVDVLAGKGITIAPLRPANSGFEIAWTDIFRDRFNGQPLKNVAVSCNGLTVRGDVMITRGGVEGGPVYGLSATLREAVVSNGEALMQVALRPDLAFGDLLARLSEPRRKQSISNFLRKALSLSPVAIGLLQEAASVSGSNISAMTPDVLAAAVNAVPLRVTGVAAIDRAISTAGGILFAEIDDDFMLRKLPGVFVAGEMLDWEAPTGGYLLQANFATGAAAGRGALGYLQQRLSLRA